MPGPCEEGRGGAGQWAGLCAGAGLVAWAGRWAGLRGRGGAEPGAPSCGRGASSAGTAAPGEDRDVQPQPQPQPQPDPPPCRAAPVCRLTTTESPRKRPPRSSRPSTSYRFPPHRVPRYIGAFLARLQGRDSAHPSARPLSENLHSPTAAPRAAQSRPHCRAPLCSPFQPHPTLTAPCTACPPALSPSCAKSKAPPATQRVLGKQFPFSLGSGPCPDASKQPQQKDVPLPGALQLCCSGLSQ